jgi:C1A family cysteine protease
VTTTIYAHLHNKRDVHDERDYRFTPTLTTVPSAADLRSNCPAIYNQLPLQSCSAHAISSALQMLAAASGEALEMPSRLFLYYNSRLLANEASVDGGATIRNAMKATAKPGVCPETLWPYDPTKVATEPARSAYEGVETRSREYFRIDQELPKIKACIAEGFPFVFGISMFKSTITVAQTTGHVQLPQPNEAPLGGHAVLGVAYDDATQTLVALNSLGEGFGDHGFLLVPYEYLTDNNLSYDFWTIREIQ